MRITLAEEIMLLSLDGASGAVRERQSVSWAVAGGLLLELVLAERVAVTGQYLAPAGTTPTGDPLLDGRVRLIEAWLRGRDKRRVTDWLTKDRTPSLGAAFDSLRGRGLVAGEQHRAPGAAPVGRRPGTDGSYEGALRARLAAVVLDGAEPDTRTAGLIALIHSARLHGLAFPDLPARQVAPRLAETAAGHWASERVRTAIRDTQAAMAAVTLVTAAGTVL
ncbi:GPP34 family phosphoprotein [Streptomyces sp. NPDC058662]|uniref:GOLPH3/VPS74 family protein n=1 Tax=Streptomyces sp. NPDC058662 TaxID=3346583 RepID=UPI0036495178